MNKADLYDIIEDILTDYDDNFIGRPDTEIVWEIVEEIGMVSAESEAEVIAIVIQFIENWVDRI